MSLYGLTSTLTFLVGLKEGAGLHKFQDSVISGFSWGDKGEESAVGALLVLILLRTRSMWDGGHPEGSDV